MGSVTVDDGLPAVRRYYDEVLNKDKNLVVHHQRRAYAAILRGRDDQQNSRSFLGGREHENSGSVLRVRKLSQLLCISSSSSITQSPTS